eukprot:SM000316S12295  [mRNA]  locus=s316:96397:100524:+ [translate_table: standard]
MSMLTPAHGVMVWPSSEVPPAKGVSGTRCSAHAFTTATTSSVDLGGANPALPSGQGRGLSRQDPRCKAAHVVRASGELSAPALPAEGRNAQRVDDGVRGGQDGVVRVPRLGVRLALAVVQHDALRPQRAPQVVQQRAGAADQQPPGTSECRVLVLLEESAGCAGSRASGGSVRNYGTEQDKAHCPFYIKMGACRFGASCSRIHMCPATSPTVLIKGMYTGPGLPLPHAEEGLEYNDEDVAEAFAEFYNDVHSEFQCFGEIHNFKVSRNRSPHLRGNVYVHFVEEGAALAAFEAIHGRFFASKQTCRRGDDCNFLHPFLNPGGEYDWADWERPPPRAWLEQMSGLFASTPRADRDKQSDERRCDSHKARRSGSRDEGDGRTRNQSGGARSPGPEAGKHRSSQGGRRSEAKRERGSPSRSTRSTGRDEKRHKLSRASRSKDRGDDVRLRGRAEDGEGARVGSEASRGSSRQRRARGTKACVDFDDDEQGKGRWGELDQYSGDPNDGVLRRSSKLITAKSYWDEYSNVDL